MSKHRQNVGDAITGRREALADIEAAAAAKAAERAKQATDAAWPTNDTKEG